MERFASNPVTFSKGYAKRFCKTFSGPCSSGKFGGSKNNLGPRKQHHALQIHYKRHLDGEQEGKMKVAEPSAPAIGLAGPKG